MAIVRLEHCDLVVRNHSSPYCYMRNGAKHFPDNLERSVGNWYPGRYAWDLQDIRPIVPIPTIGKQGFPFIRDLELLEQIKQRLTETTQIETLLEGYA